MENTLVKSDFSLDKLSSQCYFLLIEFWLYFVYKHQKKRFFLCNMIAYWAHQ